MQISFSLHVKFAYIIASLLVPVSSKFVQRQFEDLFPRADSPFSVMTSTTSSASTPSPSYLEPTNDGPSTPTATSQLSAATMTPLPSSSTLLAGSSATSDSPIVTSPVVFTGTPRSAPPGCTPYQCNLFYQVRNTKVAPFVANAKSNIVCVRLLLANRVTKYGLPYHNVNASKHTCSFRLGNVSSSISWYPKVELSNFIAYHLACTSFFLLSLPAMVAYQSAILTPRSRLPLLLMS